MNRETFNYAKESRMLPEGTGRNDPKVYLSPKEVEELKAELAKRIRKVTGQEPPTPEQAQAMAQQQQLQMQQFQLELAKLQAEVQAKQGEAQLNMAKAEEMTNIDPQLKMAELQAKIQMKMEELQLRRDLSTATNELRAVQSETNAATSIANTVMKTSNGNPRTRTGE